MRAVLLRRSNSSLRPLSLIPPPRRRDRATQVRRVCALPGRRRTAASRSALMNALRRPLLSIGSVICQKFFTNFLKEAGDPTDPVERMLLESFALAHHCAGNWSTQADRAPRQFAAFGRRTPSAIWCHSVRRWIKTAAVSQRRSIKRMARGPSESRWVEMT